MSHYDSDYTAKEIQHYTIGEDIKPGLALKVESYSYEDDDPTLLAKLEDLISSGKSTSIETLIIGEWKFCAEGTEPPFLDFLVENKDKFPNVKAMFFGDMAMEQSEMSWITQGNYEKVLAAFSHLEELYFKGGMELRLGKFAMPNLKKFHVYTGGLSKDTLKDITDSNTFQNVEDLQIWFGDEEYGASFDINQVKALLDLEMPKLKTLGLMNSNQQNDIVKLLANHPILKQVEKLDISMGVLQDEGGQVLLDGAFDHLQHIECDHHFLSDELMAKINAKFGDKISLSESEDSDGGEWFYVAVGE